MLESGSTKVKARVQNVPAKASPLRFLVGSVICVALLASLTPPAGADCAGPCGPIFAWLEVTTDSNAGLRLPASSTIVVEGTVSYVVKVDDDGYWFDPEKKPVISLGIHRPPPWLTAKVEPEAYEVPLDDPEYMRDEGSPEQVQFYWEAPVQVTVSKLRDPTPEELSRTQRFILRDGTYVVKVVATSTASPFAEAALSNWGVQEGYGEKQLHFVPEIAGVAWMRDASGVMQPNGQPPATSAKTPGPAAGSLALTVVAVALILRRRN